MMGAQQNHGFEREIEGASPLRPGSARVSRDGAGPPDFILPEHPWVLQAP